MKSGRVENQVTHCEGHKVALWIPSYPFFTGKLLWGIAGSSPLQGEVKLQAYDADGTLIQDRCFNCKTERRGAVYEIPLTELLERGKIEGGIRHALIIFTSSMPIFAEARLRTSDGEDYVLSPLLPTEGGIPSFLPVIEAQGRRALYTVSNLTPFPVTVRVRSIECSRDDEEVIHLAGFGSRFGSVAAVLRLLGQPDIECSSYLRFFTRADDSTIGIQLLEEQYSRQESSGAFYSAIGS